MIFFFITAHQLLGLIRGGSWPESDGLVQGQAAPVGRVYCVSITPTHSTSASYKGVLPPLINSVSGIWFSSFAWTWAKQQCFSTLGLKQHYFFSHEKRQKQDFPCVWENIAFKNKIWNWMHLFLMIIWYYSRMDHRCLFMGNYWLASGTHWNIINHSLSPLFNKEHNNLII